MKTIPLTKGLFALVDDSDYEWLSSFKWTAMDHPSGPVAYRKQNRKNIYMHREIVGASESEEVDHIDRHRLNNTRTNLRRCQSWQNNGNASVASHNRSGFKGVRFSKGAWEANISRHNKGVYLGRFETPKLAAAAYDCAARSYFGEFALTNKNLGLL